MGIVYHPRFEKRLIDILDYIALDKISASINFATELEQHILQILTNTESLSILMTKISEI